MTTRQEQCLSLSRQGHSTRRIARELGIAQPTVIRHLHAARLAEGGLQAAPRVLTCGDIDRLDPRSIAGMW